jgi:hypothetical protein
MKALAHRARGLLVYEGAELKLNSWVIDRRGRLGRVSQVHVAHRPDHYEIRFAGSYESVPTYALRPATQKEIDSRMDLATAIAQDMEIEQNAKILREAARPSMPHTDYVEQARTLKAIGYAIRRRTARDN